MVHNIINPIFNWIEDKAQIKYYAFYLALFLMLCSWFFAAPRFLVLDSSQVAWQTIILKSNDLTNTLDHLPAGGNNAKKVFRLSVPVIMRLARLSPLAVIFIQTFIGYLLYILCFKLTFRILKDNVSATLLTAGIAFLYFGRVAYFDINYTWFDTFAYFFLILALYSKNNFVIFLWSSLAAWTDERAFMALSIVFIFHHLKDKGKQKLNFKYLLKFNKASIAVLVAMILYLSLRLFLTYKFDMRTPTAGANLFILKKTLQFLPIGIWTFFEGFWLIYLLSVLQSIRSKNYLMSTLFILPLILFTSVSGCVTDITRSGSYLVPMLIPLIFYLRDLVSRNDLRLLLLFCSIISFLYPATIVCADWGAEAWVQKPSLYHVIFHLTRLFKMFNIPI